MSKVINVAVLGMGEVGEIFTMNLLEKIQVDHRPVNIAAVAHNDLESPIMLGFQQNGVPCFTDIKELADMQGLLKKNLRLTPPFKPSLPPSIRRKQWL